MKKCLMGLIWNDPPYVPRPKVTSWSFRSLLPRRTSRSLEPPNSFDLQARIEGRDWPENAFTMIGLARLNNLQYCVEDVIRNGVPGDLIEAGVWRGGASIFMRGILKAHGVTDRIVWVADSFSGLPPPSPDKYPADYGDIHHTIDLLRVPLEEVRSNFVKFDLLDDKVQFLKGWFSETLTAAPISRLAVLRIDADMYESTLDALTSLYPKLSVGGYVIIDDYGALRPCKAAVDDYRASNGINDPIISADRCGVFWKRSL